MGFPPLDADLSGKTCLVTGANAGIGKQVAHDLARLGAHVVLGCRSPERGERARAEIVERSGNERVELGLVDLSDQAKVRDFAAEFKQKHPELHVLVNNAGVWLPERRESPDGLELTWATNVIGYFLLTNLLLDSLQAGAPARVINVASELAGSLELDDLQLERRAYNGILAYKQSKQANRMLSWALADRLDSKQVTVNAMHPGAVSTELGRNQSGIFGVVMRAGWRVFGRSTKKGADTASWLAASPEIAGRTGEFWCDRKARRCRFRRDPQAIAALWEACQAMTQASER